MSFKFLIAADLVLATLFCARIQLAFGHAYPIIVSPADGAALKESPREIRMRFTEGVELAFSRITEKGAKGEVVSQGKLRQLADDGGFETLVNTDYGKTLILKLAFFVLMLGLGALNFLSTKPLLKNLARAGDNQSSAHKKSLRRIAVESIIGLLIFSATGLLTVLPPGVHALHQAAAMNRSAISTTAPSTAQSLMPAEGARVKILSPAPQQIFTGDQVPLKFTLTKGKRGEHVHAYVDGELMGMFASKQGTLNGIAPGRHTLELRVVAADHQTELDAKDRVEFIVK